MSPPTPHRLIASIRTIPPVACGVVGAAALLVLAGWQFNVELLKSMLHPNRVSMNPLTAVCFLLLCSALWLVYPPSAGRSRRYVSLALAICVVAFGLLRFIGHLFRIDVGIDQLLYRHSLRDNVMAPNTAMCFVLLGSALGIIDVRTLRRHYHPAQLLTLSVGCVALLALTGYLYGSQAFFQVHGYIPMALNTSICFFVLCVGVLTARPRRQPLTTLTSPTVGGAMVRRLLPAAFLIPLVLGFLELSGKDRLYDSEFGVSLLVVAVIVTFNILIWLNARLLHRTDVRRQQTEKALRSSEAFYHSLVESLPQNIFRKDRDGRFTFANQRFCTMLGLPLDRIAGKTDLDLFPQNLAEKYRADDQAVMESGETFDEVEEHVTPSGDDLYVHVIKIPLLDTHDRPLGIQGVFWDVTRREKAERLLQQTNRQLEESVKSERQSRETLQKTQATLVQTEKLAGLGQMVAGVAHEINNPLAFVSNNVAVLQRDVKGLCEVLGAYAEAEPVLRQHNPGALEKVNDIKETIDLPYTLENLPELLNRSREGLRRIQQIVRDMRDFARLDESDLHEVDVNAGIESTLNIVRGHAKRKQVALELERGDLPPIACYPAKLNQVVMNLVTNAIDASRDGGTVTVRTRAEAGNAMIEVRDTGSGIDPAIRSRIFDPFFTTKPPGEGTGLGLSISYGIVQQHGGTIELESEVGKGSTFRVIFPIREVADADAAASPGEQIPPPPARGRDGVGV